MQKAQKTLLFPLTRRFPSLGAEQRHLIRCGNLDVTSRNTGTALNLTVFRAAMHASPKINLQHAQPTWYPVGCTRQRSWQVRSTPTARRRIPKARPPWYSTTSSPGMVAVSSCWLLSAASGMTSRSSPRDARRHPLLHSRHQRRLRVDLIASDHDDEQGERMWSAATSRNSPR